MSPAGDFGTCNHVGCFTEHSSGTNDQKRNKDSVTRIYFCRNDWLVIKQYICISDLNLYYVDFLLVTIFLMKNSPAL